MASETYPRPGFTRPNLNWTSLNGPWDFLFDDEDTGLSGKWHLNGLPSRVTLAGAASDKNSDGTTQSGGESIVQKIASGTQELLENNNLISSSTTSTETIKRTIQVPFVFQAPASGINDRGVHEVLWYERSVDDPRTSADRASNAAVLLRFGAVDYQAAVWVNGHFCGGHRGGHVPFNVDITDALDQSGGAQRITVRVYDSAYDLTQPRGKQYWNAQPESIFYTPSGGIWQSVWLEVVPRARIADSSGGTVLRSNDIASGVLSCNIGVQGRRAGEDLSVQVTASFAGQLVSTSDKKALSKSSDAVSIDLDMKLSGEMQRLLPESAKTAHPANDDACWRDGVALWSPEHAQLYDISIQLTNGAGDVVDTVETYTGMRSISWTGGLWKLNGKPYFQTLCLDQGYWLDTLMTPPTQEALRRDIELAKKMGFNGCRKHQKVEDPAFYYWADKLGYLVWGEMASAYEFSDAYVDRFNQEWTEAVKLVINNPCIVTWTPVNESWGYTSLKDNITQRNHIRALYFMTKSLDPTRPINDNCGWEHVATDLTTFHDYADSPKLATTCADLSAILDKKADRDVFVLPITDRDPGATYNPDAPIMCTEFGGVNIAAKDSGRDWGYTTAQDPDDLLQRIDKLVRAIVEGGYCCAFVYTQLTDIEQEANGLYAFDRKEKIDPAKVKDVIDMALEGFYRRVGRD